MRSRTGLLQTAGGTVEVENHRFNVVDYNLDWALNEHNVHERSTPGTLTREELVAFCGTLGVGGLELMHAYWEDCEPDYVTGLADTAGIEIRTYIFFCDLAVPQEERAESVKEAIRLIDRSVALGARLGMIVPGIAKQGHQLEDQMEWMIEGLSQATDYAGSVGCTLVSENIDTAPCRPLMGLSVQCVEVCRRVDSPHFRLIFDPVPTVLAGEDCQEALSRMLPLVAHVHLKNVTRIGGGEKWHRTLEGADGKSYRVVELSEGIVDLKAVAQALRERAYEGDFLIEYQGEADPIEAVRNCVAQAENLMAAPA